MTVPLVIEQVALAPLDLAGLEIDGLAADVGLGGAEFVAHSLVGRHAIHVDARGIVVVERGAHGTTAK